MYEKADDFLFTYPNGEHVRDFRKPWARITKAAGGPNRLFHDLRRSGVRGALTIGYGDGASYWAGTFSSSGLIVIFPVQIIFSGNRKNRLLVHATLTIDEIRPLPNQSSSTVALNSSCELNTFTRPCPNLALTFTHNAQKFIRLCDQDPLGIRS